MPTRGIRAALVIFAYVQCEPGAARGDPLGDCYEIGVAGEHFTPRAQARATYDPGGARLRA